MILLIVFIMTVFYVIAVIYHLNFTSGAMLGYTIFCQVTIAVLRSNVGIFYSLNDRLGSFGGDILRASIGMAAMWWYFATVFYLFPDTCLTPHMTSLQVICMEHIKKDFQR